MSENSRSPAFTEADRQRLRGALEEAKQTRQYRRIHAVLLVAEGRAIAEAAGHARGDPRSVRRWRDRYLERGEPDDLADAPRSGRPTRATALKPDVVAEVLHIDPRELGYASTTWTVPLLARHLERLGHCLSERTLRRRLHAFGYRWKRPRYRYSSRPTRRERGAKKGL
jgi:transposase